MERTERPAGAEDAEAMFRLSRELINRYEDLTAIEYPRVLDWVRQTIAEVGKTRLRMEYRVK